MAEIGAKQRAMLTKVLAVPMSAAGGAPEPVSDDVIESALTEQLQAKKQLVERLTYLRTCAKTCDEVRRDAKFPPDALALLPKVQQMAANFGGLAITCPEFFDPDGGEGMPEAMAAMQASQVLEAMWEKKELHTSFLIRLADAVSEAVEEHRMFMIFGPLLAKACKAIQGRDFMDQKLDGLTVVTAIVSSKGPLAKLMVKLPVFKPPPGAAPQVPPMMMQAMRGQQPGEGFRLQSESFLGWLLSPTCIDTAMYKDRSARMMHFTNLARKTRPAVQQAQNLVRHTLGEVLKQAGGVINPLLRTDEATRNAVLSWFGSTITGSEARTKSSNTLDEGGGPNHFVDSMQNSPMPMHQNLDSRLQMQLMQARMMGFVTPGMSMNVFWCLLELARPIKFAAAAGLDPFYTLQEDPHHVTVVGGFSKEARFGDSDMVETAKSYLQENPKLREPPKFTTQIFWLALRAMHVMLIPAIKEELCFAAAASFFIGKDMAKMEQALGEHLVNEVILQSSNFLADLGAFLNLVMAFCLTAAWPDRAGEILERRMTGTLLPSDVSPQWSVLPSCILEDIIDILEYYNAIKLPNAAVGEIFNHLDNQMLLYTVTFMLGSGEHVKNPNLRGKATTILKSLAKHGQCQHLLQTDPVLTADIIPGCIRVFTAVEKTKQSYYDIRMQLKYQLRIPIMELFEKMLPMESHKRALKDFAAEHSDEFLKFLNQMMNDATMQLEEGLDTLQKIRAMVREAGEAALSRPSGEELADDEQTADGGDIYRRSRADPKEHCKTYMNMGNRTIRTLWSISREAPLVIVTKLNVLQQLLHNCLNACLDRLVGPRCLELKMQKGKANDFEEYNFKPKELLQMICDMYVYVGRADKDRVQKMITEDGRSYRPKTFARAVQILSREQMMSKDMLTDFKQFVNELNELAASQEAALANVTVPDEYLDPIMSEIMEDPVLLPTSNTIMDRKVIERHIMSNDDDPFNRAHLSVKDLVPQDQLREEIHAFCAKHGIAMGGE